MSADALPAAPILDALPFGVVVVGPDQALLAANAMARELLPGIAANDTARCHELLRCDGPGEPCARGCLAMRAAASAEALPEVRIDVRHQAASSALWVTGAPLRQQPGAILHLRPGDANDRRRRSEPHWLAGPELRIRALGRTVIESGFSTLGGKWLGERPGQVLKYLVCHRNNGAPADEIADSIWPGSGPQALSSTRHAVHRLRGKLEPDRTERGHSSFVVAIAGGYALDRLHIWLDVDEFERSVNDGLAALRDLNLVAASSHLQRAVDLYRGDFLADEPYAHWAYDERSRLHVLAARAQRALAFLARERDDHVAALGHLERLCELEPYDDGAHREFITALLSAGRLGDAKRRYTAFAQRIRREFEQAPSFDLRSLRPSQERPSGPV